MVLTPVLLGLAPAIGAWMGRRTRVDPELEAGIPHLEGHVIVLGFGVGGQLVSRALRDLNVPYLILELNGATVRRARAEGERIFYGDVTSSDSLHAARVESAIAIVSLLSDADATLRMVKIARGMSATIPIVVRTRYRLEADRLQRAGATVAVAEELEASLEVVAQLLVRLNIPGNVIEPLLDIFRRESTALRPVRAPQARVHSLPEAIQQMPVSTFRIEPRHWANGQTMARLDIRARTNASVIALQRDERYITVISPEEKLVAGDVLYLVGDETDVLLARALLVGDAQEPPDS
jgi:CPA2 family monovalent cation:H+ antiporter-2